MVQTTRRQFLTRTAAGALAASAALGPSAARAGYLNLSYKLQGDGWDNYNRRSIVKAAMDLVGQMSYDSVIRNAYRLSGTNYHLTPGTWERTNPNAAYAGLGYKDVLLVQLASLAAARERPVVNIYPYASEGFDWGKANHNLVSVQFSTGTFTIEGEFEIYLNHRRLGGAGDHSSPAPWAGIICHEMLHNLGHDHEKGDYRTIVQINALQQAVFVVGRGSELIVAARYAPCGGLAT